ncbi:MAG TPA: hypothetical protein VNT56_00990 [Acidimicrobiales bacterium]|nr:hypothetical protein [Acidimicrobiales bacterium]
MNESRCRDRSAARPMVVALVVVLASVLAAGQPAGADGGAKNVVLAHNQRDGREMVRTKLQVARLASPTVAPENLAVARASCSDCRTVGVAVQVVLVTGGGDTLSPQNAAVALNEGCVRCETFAAAYQYVVSADRSVTFSAEGRQRIDQLAAQIDAVAASDLEFPALEAELDRLSAELFAVVDAEIARAGARATGAPTSHAQAA